MCRHSQNSGSAIFGQSHPVLRWVTVRHHGSNEFIINNQYQQKKVFHLAVRGTLRFPWQLWKVFFFLLKMDLYYCLKRPIIQNSNRTQYWRRMAKNRAEPADFWSKISAFQRKCLCWFLPLITNKPTFFEGTSIWKNPVFFVNKQNPKIKKSRSISRNSNWYMR